MDKYLGTVGYLAIFLSSIIGMMVVPAQRLPWVAGVCILVAWRIYPQVFTSLVRLHWLIMIILLSVPPIFLVGDLDRSITGISYSSEGLLSGIQIALRILIVLISVQGLTSSVDISSIAGLLEHAGLHGLGFSLGVAMNLLPTILKSAQNAWRSLWMRGGLRKKRWRALRLLAVTIFVNGLSRAEEIALAAEVRAFSPNTARSMPIKKGKWDWTILTLSVLVVFGFVFIP
ncbi:MAG: hypothetical protein BGO78_16775 [Chloroflexi bacterium 44-23]|nr:MAG: hypothetical protein BGO78_16775 [Chloroflexi bacterium 44-23]